MNRRVVAIALIGVGVVNGCGSDRPGTTGSIDDEPDTVTLVAYDSFPAADSGDPVYIALGEFTADTGIGVDVLIAGDTGTMVSKASLTAGTPEGDVMWGVDNTFLSRAVDDGVFDAYESPASADLPTEFTDLVPNGEATPVDFGDVCVNYDIAALQAAGLEPPTSFDDLLDPSFSGKLVVENPATSSPGLAFLMGTIAQYGDDGWEAYWTALRANDVLVVDSWTEAYYESFSWAGGDRPLVISYGSSPPFEVLYATEPLDAAPTGVVASTCFRQVEFAGVLRGTDAPLSARRLVDFLVSERFQREIPLKLFVFPVNPDVTLAPEFTKYATVPDDPLALEPAAIEAGRADWI
ncbi:MAG: thiamine ABC transporter substrate-binding protein, partial [Ilumatobacteraceae bacterium]